MKRVDVNCGYCDLDCTIEFEPTELEDEPGFCPFCSEPFEMWNDDVLDENEELDEDN